MKRHVVRYRTCLCLLGVALSLLSSPASAQQPTQAAQQATQAQIDAICQACPGDYQTFCGQVPQGPAALNCLKQNMPRETAGCRQALGALSGGTATPTTPPLAGCGKGGKLGPILECRALTHAMIAGIVVLERLPNRGFGGVLGIGAQSGHSYAAAPNNFGRRTRL
jgi:hypothetical protein